MDVAVDQPRQDRGTAGIEHAVGFDRLGRIERGDAAIAHEQRADLRLRASELAGEEFADILDEQARHHGPRFSQQRIVEVRTG
jgi:hypothetical protein